MWFSVTGDVLFTPNPNPDHDRTVKPVVCPQKREREASRSQKIETRSFREEAVKHDRTGKPVVCRDVNHKQQTVVCSEQTTHPRSSREGQSELNFWRRCKSRQNGLKHFSLVKARTSIWKKKWWDPLCSQSVQPQRSMRWTQTSECPDCYFQLWNKLKILVFVSSSRRSRTTLTDKIFKPIHNRFSEKSKKMIEDMGNEKTNWVVRYIS